MGNQKNEWQEVDEILLYFSTKEAEARRGYRQFIEGGVSKEKRAELAENNLIHSFEAIKGILNTNNDRELSDERILGSRNFVAKVLKESENLAKRRRNKIPLSEIIDQVCKQFSLSSDDLISCSRKKDISKARAVISYLAVREMGYSCKEVGKILRIDLSSVSRGANRGKEICSNVEELKEKLLETQ